MLKNGGGGELFFMIKGSLPIFFDMTYHENEAESISHLF